MERKLYWGDARLDKIELVYLDNMVRIVLKKAAPQHPFDLAVFDRYLFYTDWVLHAVVRVNKITGKCPTSCCQCSFKSDKLFLSTCLSSYLRTYLS